MSYTPPANNAADLDLEDVIIGGGSIGYMYLSADMADALEYASTTTSNNFTISSALSDQAAILDSQTAGIQLITSDAATAADTLADSTFTFYLEAISARDSLASTSHTSESVLDSANVVDIVQQAINQIVSESANGADTFSLGAALTLVEVALAADTQASTYTCVMLVAELIAAVEALNSAADGVIVDTIIASDAYTNYVQAIYNQIEAAMAVDTIGGVLAVYQVVSEASAVSDSITSTGSVLNALLTESAAAFVRLNIGGELFTGWVLNAGTMAASEYQFADLAFNSACKHGDAYLMAADDGIYQFTEDADVETVMTYIKTGKMDFGSDQRKRIVNSYMVYSAKGQMVLKVTVSENSQLQTYTYQMMPFVNDDTPDARRFDLGKGMKSRYWQFEIVGEGADPIFDEIGVLPVVLSRRV